MDHLLSDKTNSVLTEMFEIAAQIKRLNQKQRDLYETLSKEEKEEVLDKYAEPYEHHGPGYYAFAIEDLKGLFGFNESISI